MSAPWAEKYRDDGLVVIGAHSPEFPFEQDVEKVRPALEARGVEYPIAMDNDFAVWSAFGNQAWPALYFIGAQGRIRHHHVGEEDYERSERVIGQLLAEAGNDVGDENLVSVEPGGVELAADWARSGRRRPTSAMPGQLGLRLPAAWNPTGARSTWSLRGSSSTNGPCRAIGRSGNRSRR